MTTNQTVHNTVSTEAEGQGRALKFRRAMKCENGHLFFVVFKLDGFSCGPMEHVRPKECSGCNLWSAQPIGSNQQFTGMQDKNGKDIYEGDLLRVRYSLSEGADGYYVEGAHEVQLSVAFGLRLCYIEMIGPHPENKNQNPLNLSLSFEYHQLGVDHRGQHYGRLAVLDTWGENALSRSRWKQNDYSSDIEIIGNIHGQERSNGKT